MAGLSVQIIKIRYGYDNLVELLGGGKMSIFEATMLICFGMSWPISIAKSLRTKVVAGKSPLFMMLLCFGYLCGIIHKLLYSTDWVILLYTLNMVLVAIDLSLYFRYRGSSKLTKYPMPQNRKQYSPQTMATGVNHLAHKFSQQVKRFSSATTSR